jgi:hypothetical protein
VIRFLVSGLLWSVICVVLFMFAIVITQMGDCFEVESCRANKHLAGQIIFIAVPLIWLARIFFLFRRWKR